MSKFCWSITIQNGCCRIFVCQFLLQPQFFKFLTHRFTFLLVQVVLQTAVDPGAQPNHYFGLAIGFVIAAAAKSIGDISGAVLNPAVGTGWFQKSRNVLKEFSTKHI